MSASIRSFPTGPVGGVVAGIAMIAAGIWLGLHPAILHADAGPGDSVAVGLAMIGAFAAVYGSHELRRRKRR
ncbi:putative membrane protein [Burkholderia cenocepacia]|uniref:Membrane protein n=1 Tax=Burkholderia cenocepacia TaxID=95486 RepID=A0AAN0VM61_9BURK|nr:putative membrane protein [Burkholderia cenocepacia]